MNIIPRQYRMGLPFVDSACCNRASMLARVSLSAKPRTAKHEPFQSQDGVPRSTC